MSIFPSPVETETRARQTDPSTVLAGEASSRALRGAARADGVLRGRERRASCFCASLRSYWSPPPSPLARRDVSAHVLDDGWRFALGHATDPARDFGHGTGYFSYLAKTGFGDGPAAPIFDDRGWRLVDLPHDWAVEAPFDPKASPSHGYKAVGRGFPERSVGWYRRSFFVPESDLGRRIRLEFDGVYRNARVFVNGFLVGEEPSGYLGSATTSAST